MLVPCNPNFICDLFFDKFINFLFFIVKPLYSGFEDFDYSPIDAIGVDTVEK
jgi:hypothetical protein